MEQRPTPGRRAASAPAGLVPARALAVQCRFSGEAAAAVGTTRALADEQRSATRPRAALAAAEWLGEADRAAASRRHEQVRRSRDAQRCPSIAQRGGAVATALARAARKVPGRPSLRRVRADRTRAVAVGVGQEARLFAGCTVVIAAGAFSPDPEREPSILAVLPASGWRRRRDRATKPMSELALRGRGAGQASARIRAEIATIEPSGRLLGHVGVASASHGGAAAGA